MRRRRQLKLPWGRLCLIFFPNQFHRWILNEVFRKVPLFLSSFISCAMENCRKSLPRASKVKIIVPPREQEKVFFYYCQKTRSTDLWNQINESVAFSDLWERKTGAKRFDLLKEKQRSKKIVPIMTRKHKLWLGFLQVWNNAWFSPFHFISFWLFWKDDNVAKKLLKSFLLTWDICLNRNARQWVVQGIGTRLKNWLELLASLFLENHHSCTLKFK